MHGYKLDHLHKAADLSGSLCLQFRAPGAEPADFEVFLNEIYVAGSRRASADYRRADLASPRVVSLWSLNTSSSSPGLSLSPVCWLRDYVPEAASRAERCAGPRVRTTRSCCDCVAGGLKLPLHLGDPRTTSWALYSVHQSPRSSVAPFLRTNRSASGATRPSVHQDAGHCVYDRCVQERFHKEKWQLRPEQVRWRTLQEKMISYTLSCEYLALLIGFI